MENYKWKILSESQGITSLLRTPTMFVREDEDGNEQIIHEAELNNLYDQVSVLTTVVAELRKTNSVLENSINDLNNYREMNLRLLEQNRGLSELNIELQTKLLLS